MIFFKIITIVLTFKGAMAERFYNVVTTTTSFVDNYQESPATALFCFKQQFVSTLGSCAILCTKEKDHPCEGFTLTIENETGRVKNTMRIGGWVQQNIISKKGSMS